MALKSYILDLLEPVQVSEAYAEYLKSGLFLLVTTDPLAASDRLRVRINLPDGNGVTLQARVMEVRDSNLYAIRLPDNEDTHWLLARAREHHERISRVVRKERGPKFIPAPGVPGPRPTLVAQDEPESRTRPIGKRGSGTGESAELPTPPPDVPREKRGDRASALDVETMQKAAGLAPTAKDLILSLAKLEEAARQREILEQVAGTTVPVAPPTPTVVVAGSEPVTATSDPGSSDQIQPMPAPAPSPPKTTTREDELRSLPENKKKKIAISGNREDREILVRDPVKAVHIWVLKNPDLTEDEAVEIAQLADLAPDALQYLLQNRKWATSTKVAVFLALNPQTPPEAIPNLLAVMATPALKKLIATAGVRQLVVHNAKRILIERTGH